MVNKGERLGVDVSGGLPQGTLAGMMHCNLVALGIGGGRLGPFFFLRLKRVESSWY